MFMDKITENSWQLVWEQTSSKSMCLNAWRRGICGCLMHTPPNPCFDWLLVEFVEKKKLKNEMNDYYRI